MRETDTDNCLDALYSVLESRRGADPKVSRTAKLFSEGAAKIAQKVGEEAVEVAIEAVRGDNSALVQESADLLYHLLVLWAQAGVTPSEVWTTLAERRGVSDNAENAQSEGRVAYDDDNIFAKILRGEIPCNRVYEDAHVLAFQDINPQTKVHILIIPKGRYVSLEDFASYAAEAEIAGLMRAVACVAKKFDLVKTGYRILANHGVNAHQEVPHFHIRLFGGEDLGRMISLPGR